MILLSVITFLFPALGLLILIICMVSSKFSRNYLSKYLVFPVAILGGMFGYSMIPVGETDLTRYFNQVNSLGGYTLINILKNDSDKLYTRDILFYYVNKCKNVHILPFIVGFIIYGIVFYVLFDIVERNNELNKKTIILMIVTTVGIIPPYSLIGNTRCVLSYTIISWAIYRDLVQMKRNVITIALYLLPLGLHISSVLFLLLRFIQIFTKFMGRAIVVLTIALPSCIELSYKYVYILGNSSWTATIRRGVYKAYYYLNWTDGGWADIVDKSLNNRITRIYGTFFLCLSIFLIIKASDNIQFRTGEVMIKDGMINFLFFVAICALGCLSIKTGAFWRFESVVVLFCPIYLVQLYKSDKVIVRYGLQLLYSTALIMTVYNVAYQCRNLRVLDTVSNFFFGSGIKVAWEMLRGLF